MLADTVLFIGICHCKGPQGGWAHWVSRPKTILWPTGIKEVIAMDQIGKKGKRRISKKLKPEIEVVQTVLNAFELKGVKALVLIEGGDQLAVLSNGVSGPALISFILGAFEKDPAVMGVVLDEISSFTEALDEAQSAHVTNSVR
jgi:hypothetical protein